MLSSVSGEPIDGGRWKQSMDILCVALRCLPQWTHMCLQLECISEVECLVWCLI